MAYYITPEQLELALGPSTYLVLFDDDNDGTANATAVDLVLFCAHARVVARLAKEASVIPDPLPATPPGLLVVAELLYARHYAYDRQPEYARTQGVAVLAEAEK